jgi:hypothetical protein
MISWKLFARDFISKQKEGEKSKEAEKQKEHECERWTEAA